MNETPEKLQNPKSIARRFLVIFAVLLGLLTVTTAVHFMIRERTVQIERETSQMLNIQLGKAALDRDLQDVISDLTFLARHNETTGLFLPDNTATRRDVAEQFRVFSKQKGKYDQIRVLDETGHEAVRVNYNQGEPVATDETGLQNKSDRY